ncbi:MAG: amidohydrolase family protein [Acidobacteria bacterium]|nr:amidohydrolase family protein [Acidobacteriota bacterium]
MRRTRFFLCVLLVDLCWLIGSAGAKAVGPEADWVLHNGKILTTNTDDPAQFSIVEAVAIHDGKFVAVGSNREVLQLAGPGTRRIDLAGKTVLPGLIETHLHVNSMTSQYLKNGGLARTDPAIQWNNREEGLTALQSIARQKKPGEWIVVNGEGGQIPMRLGVEDNPANPTLAELDQAAPNNPAVIAFGGGGSAGYFPMLVNTKALDVFYKEYPEGLPGIVKDKNGKPTGMLKTSASMTMSGMWPPATQKEVEEALPAFIRQLEEAAARGLTTLATRVDWQSMRAYMLLDHYEKMPIRMAYATEMAAYTPRTDFLYRRVPITAGHGSPWLWLEGSTPGTIEYGSGPANGDACIKRSYPKGDDPYFPNWKLQPWGPEGDCRLSQGEDVENLRGFFLNAAKNGWAVSNVHVKGDRTVDEYLDLLAEAEEKYGVSGLRFSLDHCGFVTDEQAQRAKSLGMTFTCQFPSPTGNGEEGTLGAYKVIYGVETAGDVVAPYRRLIDSGLKPSAHCESLKGWAFACMEYSVTRKDDVSGHIWGPHQRINRREALYTYTRWAAWHVWKEKYIGSIEPGKWADLVVIDKDFLTIPEEEIAQINPLLTIVGGKISYSEPKFASSMGLPTVGFQAPPDWWER